MIEALQVSSAVTEARRLEKDRGIFVIEWMGGVEGEL
jgi:hypothetical protein